MSPETLTQLAQGGIGLIGLYFINLLWMEVKLLNQRTYDLLLQQNKELAELRLATMDRQNKSDTVIGKVDNVAAAVGADSPRTTK